MADDAETIERADATLTEDFARAANLAREARAMGADETARELEGLATRQERAKQRLEAIKKSAVEDADRAREELDRAVEDCHRDLERFDAKLGKLRDATITKLRADVDRARADLDVLGVRAEGARPGEAAPLSHSLERIGRRVTAARARLEELEHAPEDRFAELKARYDEEWQAIENDRAAYDTALRMLARTSIGAPLLGLLDNWWAIELRGVLGIVLGVIALVWPLAGAAAFLALFGVFALFGGILQITAAASAGARREHWVTLLISGILGVAAGILTLAFPLRSVMAILFVVAVWAIASGIAEIGAAIKLRERVEDEWLLVVHGALWVVFGLLVMVAPVAGALVVTLLFGAFVLASGAMLVALGLRMRSMRKTLLRARAAA